MTPRPIVLILNINLDIVEILRAALEQAGMLVISAAIDEIARGETDLGPMLRMHPPNAVLYDVALPYERSWGFMVQLRSRPELKDVPFIITTTNVRRLQEIVKEASNDVIEIVGKPYDLQQVVESVKQATQK